MLWTNLAAEDLPADLASLLYRQRWRIEMFFRWLKCVLGCGHWLAARPSPVRKPKRSAVHISSVTITSGWKLAPLRSLPI
ncbi:MAG: transposase [Verrucomicrobia bacterium]|nr:transposase [Verrucomicrobiota bacterium]